MTTPVACVIVADRHPMLLTALKRVLEPRFEVIAMVDNVVSLIDALNAQEPDAIILDISMDDEDGRHLAQHLARSHPSTPIILIGDEADVPEAHRRIAGCRFVPKSQTAELLCESVADAVRRFSAERGGKT